MKVLVTGGYGFAGRHLAQYLVSCGENVAVTYLPSQDNPATTAAPKGGVAIPESAQSFALDLSDRKAVAEIIAVLKPDAIYHLAGISFVPAADVDVFKTFQINTFGTMNLLDALAQSSKHSRILVVSSAEVYGEPRPGTLPLTEQAVLRPVNAYAVSKAAADLAAFKYFFSDHLHVIRVRPFPHIGPGQNEAFSISGFTKQIAEIKLGLKPPKIKVGNLEAKRDFSDVSDIVRGYREALLNGKRGEVYNLCSGQSISIGGMLQKLIKVADVEVEIEVDSSRLRPIDIPDLYGSYDKAQHDFGWKPRIDLEGTLHSLLAYWVEYLEANS